MCTQDKKEALREEQVVSTERLTELETLLSTNLLKQQQELQERLSKADVEADRWAPVLYLAHRKTRGCVLITPWDMQCRAMLYDAI